MCKLYMSASRGLLEAQFGVHPPADCVEGEVHPRERGMLIRSGDFGLVCAAAHWGDVGEQERSGPRRPEAPSSSLPGSSYLNTTINASVVGDHPATRAAWRWGQRCLVPVAWLWPAEASGCHSSRHRLLMEGGEALALAGVWLARPKPTGASAAVCFSMITIARPHCLAASTPCHGSQPCTSVVAIARRDWVDWLEGSDRAARGVMNAAAAADHLALAINCHGPSWGWTTAAIDHRGRSDRYNAPDDRRPIAMTEDSLH